jgi:magnesium-transporting ATPase (P-type)
MGTMENCIKEAQKKQKKQKNKKIYKKNIGIYFAIVIFTILINIPMFLYLSWHFITDIVNYLSANISFLYVKKTIIFFEEFHKIMAIDFMVNIFLLLSIEFVIVCIFRKQLNKLFTMKKFLLLAIIILFVQFIFSCWLWHI